MAERIDGGSPQEASAEMQERQGDLSCQEAITIFINDGRNHALYGAARTHVESCGSCSTSVDPFHV